MLKTALLLLATQSAQPFSELPLPPKDAILHQIEHVGPLQVSGDELTFAVRLSSERVWVSGGLRQDMNLVEGTQDIWAARIKVPRCSESTISWYFGYIASNGQARYTGKSVYRGPKAALPPEERENFRGRIETREIESHSLGEKRRISIYLPSHSALDGEPLLTIYTTDGATRQIASLIEPQIDSKSLPPIAVVGVDNGGYRGDFNKPADS